MKISVITVTYNSGATLRDTLESVLRQDYSDYELLIKDGGSTDNTMDICREYEPRFGGRLKLISSPDNGPYDAMNQGRERRGWLPAGACKPVLGGPSERPHRRSSSSAPRRDSTSLGQSPALKAAFIMGSMKTLSANKATLGVKTSTYPFWKDVSP